MNTIRIIINLIIKFLGLKSQNKEQPKSTKKPVSSAVKVPPPPEIKPIAPIT